MRRGALCRIATAAVVGLCRVSVLAADHDFSAVRAEVDFSKPLREWDGFGVNYVEVAQSVDYSRDPQEYGGLSILPEKARMEIIDLVFGADGLKPGLVKMFLDPFHQGEPGGPFDHERTTRWMRHFVRKGLETTRSRGSASEELEAFRTTDGEDRYKKLGRFRLEDGLLVYEAPARSATTFFGR